MSGKLEDRARRIASEIITPAPFARDQREPWEQILAGLEDTANEEREACAKVALEPIVLVHTHPPAHAVPGFAEHIAEAIRARGRS